jgi:hypothetical protein
MDRHIRWIAAWALAAFAFLGAADPALAAKAETGDSKGTKPKPQAGSEIEVSFNPTVAVQVQVGESIGAVLERLASAIRVAGLGEYDASTELTPLSAALVVRRVDGSEPDRLSFRETDPILQSTLLHLDVPGLAAHVRVFGETPAGGVLRITLNDRVVAVPTTDLPSAGLTWQILSWIQLGGFDAHVDGDRIVVTWDRLHGTTLRVVGLHSTDVALVTSEVGLAPSD